MKVYRGDSIPKQVENVAREDRGRTFADHFCGTGLVAKFADGGSSKLLRGKDLIHMVLSHVGC
jgi:adenine-specific DNA methylase